MINFRKYHYLKHYNILSFALIIIFFITNNYYNINESIENGFMDIKSYLKIYSILTNSDLKINIPYYHLERWPVHFVIRFINEKVGISNHYYSYLIISILVLLHISKLIDKIKTDIYSKIAILSLILFNPYLMRMYICNPLLICDLLFIYSTILLTIGIECQNNKYILISSIIATITRQTSILLIPILIIFYIQKRIKFKIVFINIIIILGWQFINKIYLQKYIESNYNYLQLISIGWKISSNSFEFYINFFIRLFVYFGTIIGIWLIDTKNKIYYSSLIIFLIILIQPLLYGPNVTGNNIERLAALGTAFLIPIIIHRRIDDNIFILFNLIVSFHHHFSVLNNIIYNKYIFSIILFVMIITVLIIKKKGYTLLYNKLP